MTTYTIYKFTNLINQKTYVGWTSRDPQIRYEEHQKTRKPRNQNRSLLSLAIEKYGIENFKFEILYQTEDLIASQTLETQFIAEHKSHESEHGYNLDFGGTGKRRSEATIEKHRQKMLGKKQTPEHIAKRVLVGEKNPSYGKTGTKASRYGKTLTEDQRKNISDGVKSSIKQRKEDGTYNHPKLSEESINKMKNTKKQQAAEGKLWIQSPEGRERARQGRLGKIQTDHQKQAVRAANLGHFVVESEDGTKQTLSGMKEFATSINLTIEQFRYTLTSGKFRNGYRLIENLGKNHSINTVKESK